MLFKNDYNAFTTILNVDSKFPVEFLQELTTNLMALQPSGIHDDLEFNLMILERAAQETQISPKVSGSDQA